MEFILAQILGFIALIIVCVGFFLKTKSSFMIAQVAANFFYASAFLVVDAYVGAVLVTISLFRCIYLYYAEKYNFKYKIHLIPIFLLLYLTMTILFWDNPYDWLPLCSSTLFTIGYTLNNFQTMRYVLIIPNSILVVYNILSTTYTSALLDFVEIFVIIIAIVKAIKKKS